MKIVRRCLAIFIFLTIVSAFLVIKFWGDRSFVILPGDLSYHEDTMLTYTPGMLLNKGVYKARISYSSDADVSMNVYGTLNDSYSFTLAASLEESVYETEFELGKDAQGAKLRFEVPQGASLHISSIEMIRHGLINRDPLLLAVLIAVLLTLAYYFFAEKVYKKISREQAVAYAAMAVAVLLAFAPHMTGKLYDGNDLGGQLIRIEGVKDGIIDRQFPVVLFPRTLGEYGELGAMYPYLFLVIPAILRVLHVSVLTVYNITVLSICIFTVLVMYYCMRTLGISKIISGLTASLYLLSPGFIHGETVNGAVLGFGFAYIFIPLVFVGFYHVLMGDRRKWVMLTIGFTGMLQSHLVTTLHMIVVSVFYLIILTTVQLYRKKLKITVFADIVKAGIWCILLNIWWIALFVYYYINGNLYMGALGDGFNSGLGLKKFFMLEATWYSLAVLAAAVIAAVIMFKRREHHDDLLPWTLFFIGGVTLFACTGLFPWKQLSYIPPVKFFINTMQMTTRFYVVIGAAFTIMAGIMWDRIVKESKGNKAVYLLSIPLVIAISFLCNFGCMREYFKDDNLFCTRFIGDLSPFKQREYLPDGTDDDYYEGKHSPVVSDEENIRIEDYYKRGDRSHFIYYIDGEADKAYIELPMFYYPGYDVRLDDGTELIAETGDLNHMRIYLSDEGSGQKVNVRFRVWPVWSILTLVSVILYFLFLYFELYKKSAEKVLHVNDTV